MPDWRVHVSPFLPPTKKISHTENGNKLNSIYNSPSTFISRYLCIFFIILQGVSVSNEEDVLSSVYGTLVAGNGGGSGGDDWGNGGAPSDAEYITAIIGEFIVFNCHVEFPEGYPVPYIVQWDKKGTDIPIHIWYDGYPTHSGEGYEGRVSRVSSSSPHYGVASLNLTSIRESDRGWYNCRVYFLNRSPPPSNSRNISGSWYHLDVHAPPRFVHTSDDVVYTKVGESVILHCRAEGTPPPEVVWYKDTQPVEMSITVQITNEGTELRFSHIKNEDIGDYTCIARNGEGRIHHSVKVLIAGSAVIINPPGNMTRVEGEKGVFPCEWRAMPSNASALWFRDSVPVRQIPSLESRVETPADGSLVINPLAADDSGFYECRVTNGIGETQTATAYLNVEYPAQVYYTPTVQYLPHRLPGVVRCYIMSNPPIQFVMWTRDKHLLEPYETEGFAVMNNGSLLIDRVKETHQGMYSCTPYNVHGTKGLSLQMQVIVKEPPSFETLPDTLYQSKLGSSIDIPCTARAPNGTTSPLITWQRRDGKSLPRDRVRVVEGSLTIKNLHSSDYGEYECIVSNEVATLVAPTKIIVEGTKPHAPFNISANCAVFSVTLSWLPGYSGGPHFSQNYVVWYRPLGDTKWETLQVTPPGSTRITVRSLAPGKTYQFQIVGLNDLGEGHPSEIVNVTTKGIGDTILSPNSPPETKNSNTNTITNNNPPILINPNPGPLPPGASTTASDGNNYDFSNVMFPTYENGTSYVPKLLRPQGPRPGAPWNVTIEPDNYAIQISWHAPLESEVPVAYYQVFARLPHDPDYKPISKEHIKPPTTSFSIGGMSRESEEVSYSVPVRDKQRAIIAGLVGGILFFIVAIILSVCAVKICNRRKRRKQEKAYNMVACRLTDARNGGQIPTQPQVPVNKRNGVAQALVVISWAKRAYRWIGRGVGMFIIHLLDLPTRRHGVIMTRVRRDGDRQSIPSITLSLTDIAHLHDIPHHHSLPLILQHGQPRDVIDDSSDDGGFLASRPLKYYPRGRRRFNIVLPGSYLPSSSHLLVPLPHMTSSPNQQPHPSSSSRSISRSSVLSPVSIDLTSLTRLPLLVQLHSPPPQHQQQQSLSTRTQGLSPQHPLSPTQTLSPTRIRPTPPPWEAERLRDTLARDLDYLEAQLPHFLKDSGYGASSSFLRPIHLPEDLYSNTALGPRTYENWPRRDLRDFTSPVFSLGGIKATTTTINVPVSEASPGGRTLLDMSVDDPYEFDPVIPDTSPEMSVLPPMLTNASTGSTSSFVRIRRGRERVESMEARVAAMKEEFFEYRRRQRKRMESAC